MKFSYAKVKSIKADIAKKEITVSFLVDMTQENLAISDQLSGYVDPDAGTVILDIFPRQMKLDMPAGAMSVSIKTFGQEQPDEEL
jgi:hypothetical protein